MKQNKDQRITIRLSPEEYDIITDKAATAHISPSAYIRSAALRHKVVVVDGLGEMSRELKAIGRNLNQLAILGHEGRVQIARLDDTLATLGQIYDRLDALAGQEQR